MDGDQVVGEGVLRRRISEAVSNGVQPLEFVLAGWEAGSVAFGVEDAYSDIDLNFLLDDAGAEDAFYEAVELALEAVSPIVARHVEPPGRYFKLRDGGDFLLVDVCVVRPAGLAEQLDVERHGTIRALFDKGEWLRRDASAGVSPVARMAKRLEEHRAWFSISQSFVRKAIARGRDVEALSAYWGYTLRPLVELVRMRHCPARWDFGMRYLERDLPGPVYDELRRLMFVGAPGDLGERASEANAWAERLLEELVRMVEASSAESNA